MRRYLTSWTEVGTPLMTHSMDCLFSIVIPTHDRPRQLRVCLAALGAVDYPRERFEVIVANDGGDVPPDELVRDLGARMSLQIFSQPNLGPSAARNAAVARSRGRFLVFTDDDCVPPPDWLTRLEAAVKRSPNALVGGRTINLLADNPYSTASHLLLEYVYDYYSDSALADRRFFASNHFALPAEGFARICGFDETFRAAEDREFCRRWVASGGMLAYDPDVVMYHAHESGLLTLPRQHFRYGRGAYPFWTKHPRDGRGSLRVEPLRFYLGMLRFAFASRHARPVLLSALVLLSQIANAAGFAFEAVTRTMKGIRFGSGHSGTRITGRNSARPISSSRQSATNPLQVLPLSAPGQRRSVSLVAACLTALRGALKFPRHTEVPDLSSHRSDRFTAPFQ